MELKFIDNSSLSSSPVPAAGVVTLINGVTQNTDYNQRIGRKILLKSVLIRADIYPYNTGTIDATIGEQVRFIVFYDCQTNGAAPAVADVLQGVGTNEALNLNNRDRFKVLFDKDVSLESFKTTTGSLTTGSPKLHSLKMYKKINMDTVFGGTGATVASITSGGLFTLLISGNAYYACTYTTRVRFMDG